MNQSKRKSPDVIVAGGGLAGVAAATAAAKAGAATLLIERQPFAGGVSTASMEPCICNFFHNTHQELVVRGRPLELVERMVKLGAAHKNWGKHRGHVVFDVELGKVAMDEMLEEAGVEILYGTLVTGAIMEGNRVTGLRIANRSGEQTVQAGCVVDATGDADVANYAGAPLNVGPGKSMPHSFVFRLGNVDLDALAGYLKDNPSEYVPTGDLGLTVEEALDFYEDTGVLYFMHFGAKKMQAIQRPVQRGEYPVEWEGFKNMDAFQMHGTRWNKTLVINTGFFMLDEPDGAAMSDYLRRGRKMAHYVAAFLKGHLPGCKGSFVCATANALGIRRTRWLKNDFVMTREIYDTAPTFPDAVGRGVHVEVGTLHLTDRTFDIPLRCLMPQEVEGLLIGSGRSTSSLPAETMRTMPVTMIVGQGAGVTAAVSVKDGVAPREVDISHVHEQLKAQGVNLD